MALNLNDTREPYQDFRTSETPRYIKQMPLLVADGRNPITVAQVMERRLHSKRPDWKDNYFNTGTRQSSQQIKINLKLVVMLCSYVR